MERSDYIVDGVFTPSEKVIGSKLPWTTRCDGMPTMMGCGAQTETSVPFTRTGVKKSGWYICYGLDDDNKDDKDIILAFCPSCAAVVKAQEAARNADTVV